MARPVDVIKKFCLRARPSYLAALENGDALFRHHGITTPIRMAHFLAQIAHESGGLAIEWESGSYSANRLIEIFGEGHHSAGISYSEAQGLAYNGPAIFERVYGLGNPRKAKELGNTRPGDGYRFRGGGLMQTTGGYNYKTMGDKCGVDFYNRPELILSAEHALKPALLEWSQNKCNVHADRDDILSISRAINLGTANSTRTPNGMADRKHWLKIFKDNLPSVELREGGEIPVSVKPVPKPPVVTAGIGAGTAAVIGAGATAAAYQFTGPGITLLVAVIFAVVSITIFTILKKRNK